MWSAKGDIMVKGVEELLARIESVRRELNEQALLDSLPSPTMLEKSRELDRLLNVYQAVKTGVQIT
jgi:H2-forming N5,N10-methylenetetrahydromethanopterin dehydrogenase-like enzyme